MIKKTCTIWRIYSFNSFFEKIWIKKITQGMVPFQKGKATVKFSINNINILPLICCEIIFPQLLIVSKSILIINIFEDAWFGDSIGPHQHFPKAIFRAVENNTYLIRSANKE